MIKKIKLLLVLLITTIGLGQNTFKNEKLGFTIEQPKDWIIAKNNDVVDNIKKNIKLDAETLNKLIEQNKGTIQVVTFYKYPIETTAGIIPTIKVNLRKNTAESFDMFKKGIEESFNSIKKVFPDFTYLTTPTKTQLSELDCVKAVCTYTLKTKNGEEKVTITVFAVPVKNEFYQITFMDSEKEDNTELYDKIAKTIVIN